MRFHHYLIFCVIVAVLFAFVLSIEFTSNIPSNLAKFTGSLLGAIIPGLIIGIIAAFGLWIYLVIKKDFKKEITVELKSVELKIVGANRLKSVEETKAESQT